jgi:ATP-dependent DNA helicase
MMRKTNVYVEQLEQTRRAALGITEEDEEDAEEEETGKGKRKLTKKQASKKKAKKDVLPPMDFPQDPLVSGGALKSYQLEGVSWLIQRYIFAMHGAIVRLSRSIRPLPRLTLSFLPLSVASIPDLPSPSSFQPTLSPE